ncbi:hypothetical protein Tsubulata_031273 [Turnera subulata]|uniref:F-box domain-containing protein n=1 Tax=Turnera subulata TaxID=218843 RepID=A0A9Q0FZB7_9ROSI|nr:hypothetical protein Tsubulata_031273 [Turnera subulata]
MHTFKHNRSPPHQICSPLPATISNLQSPARHHISPPPPRRPPPISLSTAEMIGHNEDILAQILIHLPFTSLGKFRCVSKHWHSLITHHIPPRLYPPPCGLLYLRHELHEDARHHTCQPSLHHPLLLLFPAKPANTHKRHHPSPPAATKHRPQPPLFSSSSLLPLSRQATTTAAQLARPATPFTATYTHNHTSRRRHTAGHQPPLPHLARDANNHHRRHRRPPAAAPSRFSSSPSPSAAPPVTVRHEQARSRRPDRRSFLLPRRTPLSAPRRVEFAARLLLPAPRRLQTAAVKVS